MLVAETSDVELITLSSGTLTPETRRGVFDLFGESYRDANDAYLARSLATLGRIAIARTGVGEVVAFALGETRMIEVPRLGSRALSLGGIACVDRTVRRRGLFSTVAAAAVQGYDLDPGERERLVAGRVAHPASYRSFALPTAIPRPGVALTDWHKEVGAVVAAAYGAADFDAEHFVLIGDGAGPGQPAVKVDNVTDEERRLFEHVNRERGDALLVIGWFPDLPPGW